VRARFIFAYYDFWVGVFWDAAKKRLYIFPVPMLGLVLDFKKPTKSNTVLDEVEEILIDRHGRYPNHQELCHEMMKHESREKRT
jgi:hypothetical protein